MNNQQELADTFQSLHSKGNPVILFNIWDAGSAQAVESVGAKAIASGSHGVANAFGYEDGELIPLDDAIQNAARIVGAVSVPVTMDIETGYGDTADEVFQSAKKIIAAGVVGINVEDQLFDSSDLRPLDKQQERITAIRKAADESGVNIYINARSDIFKNADPSEHASLIDDALERAEAFKAAGASGFFVPGLKDIELIKTIVGRSPLPVNIIRLPGMVDNAELANAGVARISYGPGPYLQMIEWLKDQATQAIGK